MNGVTAIAPECRVPRPLPLADVSCGGPRFFTWLCRVAPLGHAPAQIATSCGTSWCPVEECKAKYKASRVRAGAQYVLSSPFAEEPLDHASFSLPPDVCLRVDERVAGRLGTIAWEAWCAGVRVADPGVAVRALAGEAVLHPTRNGQEWAPHVHVIAPRCRLDERAKRLLPLRRLNPAALRVMRAEWTRLVCELLGELPSSRTFVVKVKKRDYSKPAAKKALLDEELRGFVGWRFVPPERSGKHRAGRNLLSLRTFGAFAPRRWSKTRELLRIETASPRPGPRCRVREADEERGRVETCNAPLIPLVVAPRDVQSAFVARSGNVLQPDERGWYQHRRSGCTTCPNCSAVSSFAEDYRSRRARAAGGVRRAAGYLSALAMSYSWRAVGAGNPFGNGGPMSSVALALQSLLATFLADEFDLTSPPIAGWRPSGPQSLPPWRLHEIRLALESLISQLDTARVVVGDPSAPWAQRSSFSGDLFSLADLLWARSPAMDAPFAAGAPAA